MKTTPIFPNRRKAILAHATSQGIAVAVLVALVAIRGDLAIGQAPSPTPDAPGAQVLTRGPVHEAFAGMITFNPEPGVVVNKAPPDVIEEMPPEERPAEDNVTWIPGYWGWDDERSDFLWVSGTWRALPPGRAWMAGYWGQTAQGYQWTSGYWADAAAKETTYLPPPPATVEVGPNIAAPSVDHAWSPGCWLWYQGHYAWRPGYWAQGRADWNWMPAHYVWTPRGYIFVGGYWDYPVEHRGILFAPVYFEARVYAHRGYIYSPTFVLDLGVFSAHLFLRPSYCHYYFGDYYAASYAHGGFYASYSFGTSRHGYDPIYSHQRWEHRDDREWERRTVAAYDYRRDHEAARPPRTWAAQRNINPASAESRQNRPMVATSINEMAKRKDSPVRFQPVAKQERQQIAQRGQEVQQSRDQRRTLEAKPIDTTARKPGATFAPANVQAARSPIVAKSPNQLGKNQAPPKAQQAPKPNSKIHPQAAAPGRQPNADRANPQTQPQPRTPESQAKPTPARNEAPSRDQKAQPESQPRSKESGAKTPAQLQRNASGPELRMQPASPQRANEAVVKPQQTPPRNANASDNKAQQQSQPRAKDAATKAQAGSQRNAPALPKQTQQESQQRPNPAAAQPRETQQRNVSAPVKQPRRVAEPAAKKRPVEIEKGASQLLKKDRQQGRKGSPPEADKPRGP